MTNAVPLLQLAPKVFGGYNISEAEIAAYCALAGTVVGGAVHLAHQAVAAYGRAGGYQGIIRFLKSGSTTGQEPGGGTGPTGAVAAPLANGAAQAPVGVTGPTGVPTGK
jgi:hypothetical protein